MNANDLCQTLILALRDEADELANPELADVLRCIADKLQRAMLLEDQE